MKEVKLKPGQKYLHLTESLFHSHKILSFVEKDSGIYLKYRTTYKSGYSDVSEETISDFIKWILDDKVKLINDDTIELDLLLAKNIPKEFLNKLFELSCMTDDGGTCVVPKSYIKQHLDDLKSDAERDEKYRIQNEAWNTYLEGIYTNMKTESIYID